MAGRNWQIEGKWVEYCNCDHGCPCETMADPTYGYCTGLVAFKIDKGRCEDVRLDDLAVAGTVYLPRALHHGQGVFQPILDERADEAQREALFYILSGEDQPAGTMFQIFSACIETIKDPLFAKIDFEWDIENRRARVEIPGVIRAHSEPIRNPVTDREERIILVLPAGCFTKPRMRPVLPKAWVPSNSTCAGVTARWHVSRRIKTVWFTATTSTSGSLAAPDGTSEDGDDRH